MVNLVVLGKAADRLSTDIHEGHWFHQQDFGIVDGTPIYCSSLLNLDYASSMVVLLCYLVQHHEAYLPIIAI